MDLDKWEQRWVWLKTELNLWYRALEPFRTPEQTLQWLEDVRSHRGWKDDDDEAVA